jgi:hypothetical protein
VVVGAFVSELLLCYHRKLLMLMDVEQVFHILLLEGQILIELVVSSLFY